MMRVFLCEKCELCDEERAGMLEMIAALIIVTFTTMSVLSLLMIVFGSIIGHFV